MYIEMLPYIALIKVLISWLCAALCNLSVMIHSVSTSLPGRTTTRATHVAHVTQARDSARQRARPETTGESKGQEAQSQNCGQLKVAAKAQKENEQIHHKKQTSKRNIAMSCKVLLQSWHNQQVVIIEALRESEVYRHPKHPTWWMVYCTWTVEKVFLKKTYQLHYSLTILLILKMKYTMF